jgi:alginate O-acetyltransferase complex protein AlgI
MLFNSLAFLFLFLPLTLLGYHALLRWQWRTGALVFLALASLAFYSVWHPAHVVLLLASAAMNYGVGLWIAARKTTGSRTTLPLTLGILANLGFLGYYKYANFFVANMTALTGFEIGLKTVILPLAISFYTFQQIAYLVDISRGEATTGRASAGGLLRYLTFVLFFPRMIQGPIVHYREIIPQFAARHLGRFWRADLMIGFTIFAIGLFKKTVIADSAGGFASPVFDVVQAGDPVSFLMGWQAAICYTIQLYFDFSGYSDMAVGLARMFGILLPANFHSPLRAASIVDYWRRWHMTLQQFIVLYMYQPLALPIARFCATRRYGKWASFAISVALPTIVIFMGVGFWHGAAWTFILFGLIHGVYLAVNEFWRALRRKSRRTSPPDAASMVFYHVLTLFCVIMANVLFRAASPADALVVWQAMLAPVTFGSQSSGFAGILTGPLPLIGFATFVIALMPNTQQLMHRYRPVLHWEKWSDTAPPVITLTWRPTVLWTIWTGMVFFFGVIFILGEKSGFIYINF